MTLGPLSGQEQLERKTMWVLIDYDNVPDHVRGQGAIYLADKVFGLIRPHLGDDHQIEIKLYGGWYERDRLTRKAQDLVLQLTGFPYPLWIKDTAPARLVRVTANLAHSLEALPKKLLHSTFRQRPPARRFACDPPSAHGCSTTPCPLVPMVDFINNQRCSTAGCNVRPRDLFRAVGEQKLVDTMLVADLVHLAQRKEKIIAIVTSDDDVWPGIISARVAGAHVLHLRPGSSQSGLSYSDGVPGKYTEVTF